MCRFSRVCFLVLLLTALTCSTAAAQDIKPLRQKLSPFNIDIRQSSVSGLSAGGFMAGQFFVAYSGIMSGVGVFAGGPYGCARGSIWKALNDCMARPSFLTAEVMTQLTDRAGSYSREGRIDPVENLKAKKYSCLAAWPIRRFNQALWTGFMIGISTWAFRKAAFIIKRTWRRDTLFPRSAMETSVKK